MTRTRGSTVEPCPATVTDVPWRKHSPTVLASAPGSTSLQWSQQQFQHLDLVWERGIITVSSHCLNRGFSNITAWMKTLDQHLKVVTLRIKTRPVSLWPRTAGSRTWVMTLRSQFWLLFDRRIYVELTERDSSALNRCELKTCQQVH